MKAKSILKKYFNKRIDAVGALMTKPNAQFTGEDFHQLRVEIKKIRALTAMLKSVENFKSKKTVKPFKKIFDQAGKVREIQLEETMLKRSDTQHQLKLYLNHLHEKKLREKENFSRVHQDVNGKLKKAKVKVPLSIRKIHKADLKKYVKKKKKAIVELVKQEKLKISEIHELRKALKKFHYDIKSLDLKEQIFQDDDAMQELMGKWHDSRVMHRHFLKAMDNQVLKRTERRPMRAIADKLNLKSRKLFEKINRQKQKVIT
jgi:CHAD domain-containing protein